MAKRWPDEQEPHRRQLRRMRRPRTLKSETCAEGVVVDAAGINVKAGAHYPGRSPVWFLRELASQRCVATGREKSAEIIVAGSRSPAKDRTEERQRGLRP